VVAAFSISLASVAVAGAIADDVTRTALWGGGSSVGLGAELAVLDCVLGAFILTRHAANRLGIVLSVNGLVWALTAAADQWATHALVLHPATLSAGGVASWFSWWSKVMSVALGAMTVLLFPDAVLRGRRRLLAQLAGVGALIGTVPTALLLWHRRGPSLLHLSFQSALGAADVRTRAAGLTCAVGMSLIVSALLAGIASLAVRGWRAPRAERAQIKWFAYGVLLNFVFTVAGLVSPATALLRLVGPVLFTACIAVAIFRYRLYEIDRLINRTLVYGSLSAVLVLIYVATVVALGDIAGGAQHSSWAVAVSTLGVAALFAPFRRRIQALVDRRFDRRTYEAVTRVETFTRHIGDERPRPGVLERVLGEVLRDPDLRLCFTDPGSRAVVDCWGTEVALPEPGDGRRVTPVERNGERLGLVVHVASLDTEPVLLARVLEAAGGAFEHARLQAELGVQLAEVKASRARVVAAGDEARRRVERDLHDGAQQRLVALALGIRGDQRRLGDHVDQTIAAMFDRNVAEIQEAVDELRELAQGVLPQTLASDGLAVAIEELAERSPAPVVIEALPTARLSVSTELTAWFVASEAFANALKHADGSCIRIAAQVRAGRLIITVSDNGPGGADISAGRGLRGLADRVEAQGGALTVTSAPGHGTAIAADIPCG